ncbi:hypothetical protein VYF65_004587 [Lysinibacillus irui]
MTSLNAVAGNAIPQGLLLAILPAGTAIVGSPALVLFVEAYTVLFDRSWL